MNSTQHPCVVPMSKIRGLGKDLSDALNLLMVHIRQEIVHWRSGYGNK